MPNFIDETGNKYGRLKVKYRATQKGQPIKWHCVCDCGKEIDVLGTSLRSGNTKSCGCLKHERIIQSNIKRGRKIEEGQVFNYLTIIGKPYYKNNSQERVVDCKCICGKIISPRLQRLVSGETKSCGCVYSNKIDEIGNRYGKLTVIEEAGRNNEGRVLWKCKCDCGNTKIALGKSLRAGLVNSCGCLHSKGEQKIQEILESMNIKFIREYSFNDLRTKNMTLLYFDFFLPDLNICIEYQGKQHYNNIPHHWNGFSFKKLQKHDKMKCNYCKNNNIKLIEISYKDYDKLSKNYLKLKIEGDA